MLTCLFNDASRMHCQDREEKEVWVRKSKHRGVGSQLQFYQLMKQNSILLHYQQATAAPCLSILSENRFFFQITSSLSFLTALLCPEMGCISPVAQLACKLEVNFS